MLEVCVDTVQSAIDAARAGAQRIELCAALDVGGVTPSRSLIEAARSAVDVPMIVLIRPRSGDFQYDASERQQILSAADEAAQCGAQGLAVGALLADGQLDRSLLQQLRHAQPDIELVMHRAFDSCSNPTQALQQLVELGYDRILTSGGAAEVSSGCEALRQLRELAGELIEIIPGGGVTAHNAAQILRVTGCDQLHGSFRKPALPCPDSQFGTKRHVDPLAIACVRQILDRAGS